MYSVVKRVRETKQPRGGYIKPKDFIVISRDDGITLNPNENVKPNLVGLAVDYLTRFMLGTPAIEAFSISISGAVRVGEYLFAQELVGRIKGLDKQSIIAACKLVGFDVAARMGTAYYTSVKQIKPNSETIMNIRTMVNRTTNFFTEYGPIVLDGFTFEGGYTDIISSGDGDYLTNDTIWELKVLKSPIKTQYTLQLYVYYLMGMHSIHNEFKDIRKLGIFNPRLNQIHLLDIDIISADTMHEVSSEVIGYQCDESASEL